MGKKSKAKNKGEQASFEMKEEFMKVDMTSDKNLTEDNTILVKRTIRSGQSVNYDGNVVILGDVNPGGEVIAGGSIIIMGCLRGVAHAGATGNEDAVVTAFKLKPTQLRIANHITRSPDEDLGEPNCPEIAKIKDGTVIIEIYPILSDRQTKVC